MLREVLIGRARQSVGGLRAQEGELPVGRLGHRVARLQELLKLGQRMSCKIRDSGVVDDDASDDDDDVSVVDDMSVIDGASDAEEEEEAGDAAALAAMPL